MLPYGLPRAITAPYPDVADLHRQGAPSRVAGKAAHGTRRAGIRSAAKRATRRGWKKLARREAAAAIRELQNSAK